MLSCSEFSTLSTYAVKSVTSMAYSSSHSCVGAPGEKGLVVYPWSPGPVTLGRLCLRNAQYSAELLLASRVGWWRCRALDRCVQGSRPLGGGCGGALCGPGSAGPLAAGLSSGGVRSICCSVSSMCWSSSSSRLRMSRAMGSSWVFTCWGAASWRGGCVMFVARGTCRGQCGVLRRCPGKRAVSRGCGVWLLAGGSSGWWWCPWARFGLWLLAGVEVACGVWGFQGWCRLGGLGCGAGVARLCSCVGGLWCCMSRGGEGECSVVWWCWVVWWPSRLGGGGAPYRGLVGWVVARSWSSGGVGQPRAVSRSSLWIVSVRGLCGVVVVWGLGSPRAGCVGLECRNQGDVVAWCLGVSAHR